MSTVPRSIRQQLLDEALGRCAYCHTPTLLTGAQLVVDHIAPRAASGRDRNRGTYTRWPCHTACPETKSPIDCGCSSNLGCGRLAPTAGRPVTHWAAPAIFLSSIFLSYLPPTRLLFDRKMDGRNMRMLHSVTEKIRTTYRR